jgi:hypothetical protein
VTSIERSRFGPRRARTLLAGAAICNDCAYTDADDIGYRVLGSGRLLSCNGYACERPGKRHSMKVRRESQSRFVHPSKLSVSSFGQTQVEDVEDVVRA